MTLTEKGHGNGVKDSLYVFEVGINIHLFVKVLRPGDSERTFSVFESSYHLFLSV